MFPRLYAIIDAARSAGRLPGALADALAEAGVTLIQYRHKRASSRELYEACREVRQCLPRERAKLIVNDRADVALAVEADGVHVGQEDLPIDFARRVVGRQGWVGVSTHTLSQVVDADRSTADYIAFGPVFATANKDHPDPVVGARGLREARRLTSKPLVAIGGITVENCREVIGAGADSVAVIGDLMQAEDIGARAREFLRVLSQAAGQRTSGKERGTR